MVPVVSTGSTAIASGFLDNYSVVIHGFNFQFRLGTGNIMAADTRVAVANFVS